MQIKWKFIRQSFFIPLPFISGRATKPEKNDELQSVERQVEKYRDVLQIISKKVSPPNSISGQDQVARDKRLKKIHEYMLGQAMEDSAKDLPDGNSLFRKILDYCGECGAKNQIIEEQPISNNE